MDLLCLATHLIDSPIHVCDMFFIWCSDFFCMSLANFLSTLISTTLFKLLAPGSSFANSGLFYFTGAAAHACFLTTLSNVLFTKFSSLAKFFHPYISRPTSISDHVSSYFSSRVFSSILNSLSKGRITSSFCWELFCLRLVPNLIVGSSGLNF